MFLPNQQNLLVAVDTEMTFYDTLVIMDHKHVFKGQKSKVCECGISSDQECAKGHLRSESSYKSSGRWVCRICQRERVATYRAELMTPERHERWKAQMRKRAKEHHRELRQKVLDHYGAKCACCGESEPAFLAMDHIGGGGNKHRRELGARSGSLKMYRWIINNGFPDTFQTLCHNCNQAKHVLGTCPHQTGGDA